MVDNNLNESPKSELFIKLEENKEALQNLNFQKIEIIRFISHS